MAQRGTRGNGLKPISFRVCTEPGCAVYVAGTFNDWRPGEFELRDATGKGVYQAKVKLPPGRYEYKFVVNQVWCADPGCNELTPNEFGSLNSVLQV